MATLIGALNEGPLHESLKQLYAEPGDRLEEPVGRYVADIVKPGRIVEIHTGGFSRIRNKLYTLLKDWPVTLVAPVACQKWIVKDMGDTETRRRSPKKTGMEEIFRRLVSIPDLLDHPGFELEIVATVEEELRRRDGRRNWRRRGWSVVEHRLQEVLGRQTLRSSQDIYRLFSAPVPERFESRDLRELVGGSTTISQMAAYCLYHSGAAKRVAKRGNAHVYERTHDQGTEPNVRNSG